MRATIELEIDLLMDTVGGIAAALHAAADAIQGYTPVRRGLAIYLLDKDGADMGCVALFGGARDMPFVAGFADEPLHACGVVAT